MKTQICFDMNTVQYTKFADLRRMNVNISDITEKNVGYLVDFLFFTSSANKYVRKK